LDVESFKWNNSFLTSSGTALDALSNIDVVPKPEALAMLDFVALAQNFWPWATYDSAKHATFVKSISNYVGTLKPIQPSSKVDESMDACYQTKIASYVAEILAMHLFHSRQTGNNVSTKELLPNLSYFTRFAVAVPHYNSSLHGNLKRNFEARYPGCSILDFERTILEKRPLGREYFYDLPLMDKTLGYDVAWRRRDGFRSEVANANVNLSLVDAQIVGFSFFRPIENADRISRLFFKVGVS
jgi:nuclear pore complex protein Nup188